jgi:predicted O-methyltransferase YrrM
MTTEELEAEYLSRPDLHGKLLRRKDRASPFRAERRLFALPILQEEGGIKALLDAWEEATSITLDAIPGWYDYASVYTQAVRVYGNGAKFVECGGYCGRSSCHMATLIRTSGKKISLDVIDTFGDASFSARPETFRHFAEVCGVDDLINLRIMDQLEAVKTYETGSLDFVFLDSDHSYEGTRDAIMAFLPKLKPDGTLAGHDYNVDYPGVIQAVDELLPGFKKVGMNTFVHGRLAKTFLR